MVDIVVALCGFKIFHPVRVVGLKRVLYSIFVRGYIDHELTEKASTGKTEKTVGTEKEITTDDDKDEIHKQTEKSNAENTSRESSHEEKLEKKRE